MFIADGLKKIPDNFGWIIRWAVVRHSPWHLVGECGTKDVAET